jgi:hypothetical protein
LEILKSLAREGIEQLDQGRGIKIEGDTQLASFVAGIGQRAAAIAKRQRKAD